MCFGNNLDGGVDAGWVCVECVFLGNLGGGVGADWGCALSVFFLGWELGCG